MAGRKRHLPVDTPGLIWGLAILPAAPTDWDGAAEVFARAASSRPRLATAWADSNDRAAALAAGITARATGALEVVLNRPGQTTSEVRKWRWVVERTFGWFNRYRRLPKDDEHNPRSSDAWVCIAMIHRMSRFTLPERNRDDDLLRRPRRRRKS